MRFHGLLVSAMAMTTIVSCGNAQTSQGGNPPAFSTPVPANDNAIIAEIKRVDPLILAPVQSKLYRIRTGTLMPGLRGADPSVRETEEIAANPVFAEAYQRDPVSTLMLLRWVNQELRKNRRTVSD